MSGFKTVNVGTNVQVELRPPKKGRTYLEIINDDAAAIRYAEGTIANAISGIPIAANTSKSWGAAGQSRSAVPQGNIWLVGTTAGPQRVIIKEN